MSFKGLVYSSRLRRLRLILGFPSDCRNPIQNITGVPSV
jgi:hypothetical protein